MLPQDVIKNILTYFPAGLCAIDLETTGLSPLFDKIIEIAAVKLCPDGSFETFERMVQPQIIIPPVTIAIHKITDEMVKDAPIFKEITSDLLDFMDGTPLLAHNAQYDLSFLMNHLVELKLELPSTEVFCSCQFSRAIQRQSKSHKLGDLIQYFGIDEENSHRALADTKACLHIFGRLLPLLPKEGGNEFLRKKAFQFRSDDFMQENIWKLPRHLDFLKDTILQKPKLEIVYQGGSYRNQWRPIIPNSFLPLPGGLVLKAECLFSNDYKSFMVKKIKQVRLLEED